jgi:hypothetical protein
MANRSTRLQYEDFDQACPDLSPSFENFDTESLNGMDGYFTFFVPGSSQTNQLELWMSLLDAAWAVRMPLAGPSERGIYHVLRSVLNEAAFDIEGDSLAEYCKIVCFKLGVRCDPNHCCAHYQHQHGRRAPAANGGPDAQFYRRPDEARCQAPSNGARAPTSPPDSNVEPGAYFFRRPDGAPSTSEEPGDYFFRGPDVVRGHEPGNGARAPPSSPASKKSKQAGFPAGFDGEPASTSGIQRPPVFKMSEGQSFKAPRKAGDRAE